MRLKPKLYLGFGLIIALMGFAIGLVAIMLTGQVNSAGNVVDKRYHTVDLANNLREQIHLIDVASRDIILANDIRKADAGFAAIDLARSKEKEVMEVLQTADQSAETEYAIQRISKLQQQYILVENGVRSLVRQGRSNEAASLLRDSGVPIRAELSAEIDRVVSLERQSLEEALRKLNDAHSLAMQFLLYSFILTLAIGLYLTYWFTKGITKSVEAVTGVIGHIDITSIDRLPRVPKIAKDEIGDIAATYNRLADALEGQVRHENEIRRLLKNQTWIKTELADIAIHNQGMNTYKELGAQLIARLAKTVEANYGVFYLRKQDGNFDKIVSLAVYAGRGKTAVREELSVGEGIVGQCALEQQPILLTDIPKDYIKISSGLGESSPHAIITVPVVFKERTLAVIELASFAPFTALQRDFLDQAAANIAVTLHRIENRLCIEQLLSDSQALAEKLQTQSEELQMQQEELRSINEQLEQQYRASEEKTKEIEAVKNALEEKACQVEISSRYKSEFLANMSHELRTPLNSMLILAQILSENTAGNLTNKQVEFAKTIYSSGNDLLSLINDILDLSKIESGKMTIAKAEINMAGFIEELQHKFLPMAQHKDLVFTVQVEDNAPSVVYTDELRLEQIMINLLSNAFKFTEQGGVCLTISCHTNPASEKILIFAVADSGIGIAPDQQKAIFQEFYQADGTNSRKYGGTGLGLSISRKLAYLLGGHIELESRAGQGSTFRLVIPVAQAGIGQETEIMAGLAEPAVTGELTEVSDELMTHSSGEEQLEFTATDRAPVLNKRKILLVDDDMRNVYALTTALENLSMEVVFGENGQEAIDILATDDSIDLVLMDIMMPEMDGYEAIRRIREKPEFEHLPIIALTAKAMKSDRERCLEVGASDYISKPVNLEQLHSLIKVWLYKQ